MRRKTCQVCGRREGVTVDRCGNEDGLPLGRLEKCVLCGKWACPDCLAEADCCFGDDELKTTIDHPPNGWKYAGEDRSHPGFVVFERIEEKP